MKIACGNCTDAGPELGSPGALPGHLKADAEHVPRPAFGQRVRMRLPAVFSSRWYTIYVWIRECQETVKSPLDVREGCFVAAAVFRADRWQSARSHRERP